MRIRAWVPLLIAAALVAASAVAPAPATALNDQLYPRQWGLEITGAKAAWDRGLFGAGVEVAVIDTGAHLTHQDLAANLRPGRNFINDGQPPQDDHCVRGDCGHGTHVAGIAVASIDNGGSVGVAPHAGLVPVKALTSSGTGNSAVLGNAIRWAADQGAEVINLSFGPAIPLVGTSSDIFSAVRYAWSKGSICVLAAGNGFIDSSDVGDDPVMVVSATNRHDSITDFSDAVGDARWGMAAPGGGDTVDFDEDADIWSTAWTPENRNDQYTQKRGTSQAAPFVSGAAALLRAAGLSPQETVDRLLATAKDLGDPGRDDLYGAGRLDIAKATEGLAAPQTVATTTAPPTTVATAPVRTTPTTARQVTATTTPTAATTTAVAPDAGAPPPAETLTTAAPPATTAGDGVAAAPPADETGAAGVPLWLAGLGAGGVGGVAAWWLAMRKRAPQ